MIGTLLPAAVVTVEAGDADWTAPLPPEEEALVARAIEKRRREFTAGRTCARRALERLGYEAVPVLAGPRREPLWPPGVVGAITHCRGYCAAAVARREDVRCLGIDAEVRGPLPAGVAELVCTERERGWAAAQPDDHWGTLVFSAKESVYKAWYPVTERWLGYLDADLTFDPERACFDARVLPQEAADAFPWNPLRGRFAVGPGHVFTAVAVPARTGG